jgi:uridine kinase
MDEYRSLDALAEALGAWIDAIPVRCRGGAGISRVVAVTGPPGMGKTTACLRLSAIDPDVSVVHLDEYLRERSFRRSRGLSPFDLLAWEHERALIECQAMFRSGAARIRPYSVASGQHGEAADVLLRRTVILDGTLAALCDSVRHLADATVAFTADPATIRVLRRDRDRRHGRVDDVEAERLWFAHWPTLRDNVLPVVGVANLVVEVSQERLYRLREAIPLRPPSGGYSEPEQHGSSKRSLWRDR